MEVSLRHVSTTPPSQSTKKQNKNDRSEGCHVNLSEEWTGTARFQILIFQKTRKIEELAEEGAELQAAHRNRGFQEVLTDDKLNFKEIADARQKLEKDTGPAFAVHGEGRPLRETADL